MRGKNTKHGANDTRRIRAKTFPQSFLSNLSASLIAQTRGYLETVLAVVYCNHEFEAIYAIGSFFELIVLPPFPPQDAPDIQPVIWPPGRSPGTCLECLMEMGFCDRKLNERLLKKHNNNVALVVNELLSLTDNEWSARRH